jgi:hypothetical protein
VRLVLLLRCRSEWFFYNEGFVWLTIFDRYAMDIRINEGVMRDDERMRVISDETNVNIVM